MKHKIIGLDRDGTINIDHGYVGKAAEVDFTPSAIEGLQLLDSLGYTLVVFSNQSGVNRGKIRREDVYDVQRYIADRLARVGVRVHLWLYCFHRPADLCECRKPNIGLIKSLSFEVDWRQSWMVGDKLSDVQFGKRLGMKSIILPGKYNYAERDAAAPYAQCDSLFDAALLITRELVEGSHD